MNRELKFRVWTGISMEYNVVVGKDGAFYALIDRNDSACLAPTSKYHSDTPVMQYTGLTDSKNKEIFEGDIVKYQPNKPIDRVGTVEYSDYYNGWCIRDSKCYPASEFGVYSLASPFMSFNHVEVIGNIFENSELLK